jgi:gliding motility-associated-like protein
MKKLSELGILAIVTLLFIGLFSTQSKAQNFVMSDTTVTNCSGRLYDTGGASAIYLLNDTTTFAIQNGGAITMTFTGAFGIEDGQDFLLVYDGDVSTGTLLATITGFTAPTPITASSGTATLVFQSNEAVSYVGFTMNWTTVMPEPTPPLISLAFPPNCGTSQLTPQFSFPLDCAMLSNAEWRVLRDGEVVPLISATPSCENDQAVAAVLVVADPLVSNCSYSIEVDLVFIDFCGEERAQTVSYDFEFTNCPINADVSAYDLSICQGSCTQVRALVEGCSAYTYSWDNGLPPTPGPHSVCPTSTTTYHLTIAEVSTGVVNTFEVTVNVEEVQITTAPQTLCQSADDVVMEASTDGIWFGDGIEFETNIFDPDSVAGGGNTYVFFATDVCVDSVMFTVTPIQTDDVSAACPGTAPLQLNATPTGGTWSGPFTNAVGIFNPTTAGSYEVTYTLGGCTDINTVNVADITGDFALDTICQSVWYDTIQFAPLGGYWEGAGIVDSLLGVFSPAGAAPGLAVLNYVISGCHQEMSYFVKEINSGAQFGDACPSQNPLVFYTTAPTPSGGTWSGSGVINANTGLFDPSLIPNDTWTSAIYSAPNGCSDTTFVYVIQTEVQVETLEFCASSEPFELNEESVQYVPTEGGTWTGIGITQPTPGSWFFNPAIAGIGTHVIYYNNNTCTDSISCIVYSDNLNAEGYILCSVDDPLLLETPAPTYGTWSGSVALGASSGVFDPGVGEDGNYFVYWTNPAGCTDSIGITLEIIGVADITGLNDFYCFIDSVVTFDATPAGGILTGVDDFSFNPVFLGIGTHLITYTVQGVSCQTRDSVNVRVYPPIGTALNVSDDVLCPGEVSNITVTALGGNTANGLTYTWSEGGSTTNTSTLVPEDSRWIYITTSDDCSIPSVDSVFITVSPPIEAEVITSDTLCYGADGFVQAQMISTGNYQIRWDNVIADELTVPAGTPHNLLIVDLDTQCTWDSTVFVPSYSNLQAAFVVNPNISCIPLERSQNVGFIDNSDNVVSGTWDFGNGVVLPWSTALVPAQAYPGPGLYEVTLNVVNEGNCTDSETKEVCILPEDPIFIPDIFSPNGDGNNDTLFVRSRAITNLNFSIYNRWGERVFNSRTLEFGWDGNYQGKPSATGNYVYFLSAVMPDGSPIERKGEIAIIR